MNLLLSRIFGLRDSSRRKICVRWPQVGAVEERVRDPAGCFVLIFSSLFVLILIRHVSKILTYVQSLLPSFPYSLHVPDRSLCVSAFQFRRIGNVHLIKSKKGKKK